MTITDYDYKPDHEQPKRNLQVGIRLEQLTDNLLHKFSSGVRIQDPGGYLIKATHSLVVTGCLPH